MTELVRTNRTGVQTSPLATPKLEEAARNRAPDVHAPTPLLDAMRRDFAKDAGVMGSVPPPATASGMTQSIKHLLKGKSAAVYVDRLGQRLAFERSGVRLYDAALTKLTLQGSWRDGSTLEALKHIRNEELEHARMLQKTIMEVGADPTAMTPAANVSGVMNLGIVQVVSDARTTLSQAVDALLVVELADDAGWDILLATAREFGLEEHARAFAQAKAEEDQHVAQVRGWALAANLQDVNNPSLSKMGSAPS